MAGANGEAPAFPDARWVDNLPIVIQNRVIEGFGNAGYDKVGTDAGKATLPVVVDARVAAGSVWIESGHGATAPLGAARVSVVAA